MMRAAKPKVFCIGMHKTGTTSFHVAMRQLGYRMPTGTPKKALWEAILAGEFERPLRDAVAAHDAFEDNPFFWHRIDARDTPFYAWAFGRYPDARFVLTTRATTESWARSVEQHIRRKRQKAGEGWTGSGLYRKLEWLYGREVPELTSFAACPEVYERYNAGARRFFAEQAPERFIDLCWEKGHGWPELCGFLGRRKPLFRAFPHSNDSRRKAAVK